MAALWRDPNFLPHPYFYTRLLFTPLQVLGLLNGNGFDSPEPWKDWLEETARGSKQLDDFTAVSCLESRSYMVDTLLRDTDSMSMAHSLEVRVPFLDHALVEFVARLPGSIKRDNGRAKSLLVDAVADLLPAEVVSQQETDLYPSLGALAPERTQERSGRGIPEYCPAAQGMPQRPQRRASLDRFSGGEYELVARLEPVCFEPVGGAPPGELILGIPACARVKLQPLIL